MMKVVVCLVLVALQPLLLQAFVGSPATTTTQRSAATRSVGVEAFRKEGQQEPLQQQQQQQPQEDEATTLNRRTWIQRNVLTVSTALLTTTITTNTRPALAATRPPLNDLLYTILRVREATEQETRLISTGKFKDVQRANIKLAVKFMVENYRLADACVGAAAYLDGNERRIAAGNVGQAAVQNLVTILEYFDAADVQNLKVGSNQMAGKESLVLKGLDAARKNIDEFLTYFPASEIETAKAKIESENQLNIKEFDPALGAPINLPPKSV